MNADRELFIYSTDSNAARDYTVRIFGQMAYAT
jgi:hypothetical protein